MQLTADMIIEAVETAGLVVHRYSGRNMGGRDCIGVHTDRYFLKTLAALVTNAESQEIAAEIVRSAVTDSMGHGTVIYWPPINWPDGRPDGEDDNGIEGDRRSWNPGLQV